MTPKDSNDEPKDVMENVQERDDSVMNENKSLHTVETSDAVGKIIVEDELLVSLDDDHHIKAYIFLNKRDDLSLGSYVQIPLVNTDKEGRREENSELLAMVKSLRYINNDETDQFDSFIEVDPASDNIQKNYPMTAKLEPISTVSKEFDGGDIVPKGINNISTPPKPYTQVYLSNNKKFLREGLQIPEEGIGIGRLSLNGQEIPAHNPILFALENPGYSIDDPSKHIGDSESSVLWRHMLVCGSTGTGKTHTCKNILRQIHKERKYKIEVGNETKKMEPNIIIIDPESEYHQMSDDPEDFHEQVYSDLEDEGVKVGGIDEIKNFYPEINANTGGKSDISNRTDFSIPFSLVRDYYGLLLPFDAGEPTKDAIKNITELFFEEHVQQGNPATYKEFKSWLNNIEDDYITSKYDLSDGIYDAVKRRVLKKKTFRNVFDANMQSVDNVYSDLFKEGQVSVIPTGHLTSSQEKLVVMSIMSIIVNNKIGNPSHDMQYDDLEELPVVLTIDEAHNYLDDPTSLREEYIISKFKDVAKRGRKYRLGLVMITQNPEDIHDSILKQTNTKIYLGLEGEVLDRVNLSRELKQRIQNFGKGQMMVKTPGIRPVEVKGFEKCLTKHES